MSERLFLYEFKFVPYTNPPQAMERFREELRAYLVDQQLDYGMSALGGMVSIRGDIRRKDRHVSDLDRQSLAQWASQQQVKCECRLGAIEEDHPDLQLFREITEWVFPIDNLMAEERTTAAQWKEEIHRQAQANRKPGS